MFVSLPASLFSRLPLGACEELNRKAGGAFATSRFPSDMPMCRSFRVSNALKANTVLSRGTIRDPPSP